MLDNSTEIYFRMNSIPIFVHLLKSTSAILLDKADNGDEREHVILP